jgi:hypothetical protein
MSERPCSHYEICPKAINPPKVTIILNNYMLNDQSTIATISTLHTVMYF